MLATDAAGGVQVRRLRLPVDGDGSRTNAGANGRPVEGRGHLGAHVDALVVVAVPVDTAVLLQDGKRARLDGGALKVEPEIQLQRLRRGRLDADVLVLRVEEQIGRVGLGEITVRARLAASQKGSSHVQIKLR